MTMRTVIRKVRDEKELTFGGQAGKNGSMGFHRW